MIFFGCSISSVNSLNAVRMTTVPLKYVSMNNQECKIRPEIINIIINKCQELMKQDKQNDMKHVNVKM